MQRTWESARGLPVRQAAAAAAALAAVRLAAGIGGNSTALAAQAVLALSDLLVLAAVLRSWSETAACREGGREPPGVPVVCTYIPAGLFCFIVGAGMLAAALLLTASASRAAEMPFLAAGTCLFLTAALKRRLSGARQVRDALALAALDNCLRRDFRLQVLVLGAICLTRGGFPLPEALLAPALGIFTVRLAFEAVCGALTPPGSDPGGRLIAAVREALPPAESGPAVIAARLYRCRRGLCLCLILRPATAGQPAREHAGRLIRSRLRGRFPELARIIILPKKCN